MMIIIWMMIIIKIWMMIMHVLQLSNEELNQPKGNLSRRLRGGSLTIIIMMVMLSETSWEFSIFWWNRNIFFFLNLGHVCDE